MSEGSRANENEAAIVDGLIQILVPDSSLTEEPSDELVTVSKLDEVVKGMQRQNEDRIIKI